MKQRIHDELYQQYYDAAKNAGSKEERGKTFKSIKEAFLATMSDEEKTAKQYMLRDYIKAHSKKAIRDLLLNEGIRLGWPWYQGHPPHLVRSRLPARTTRIRHLHPWRDAELDHA